MIACISRGGAGVSAAVVPMTPSPCTPAGVSLKRLSQASGLRKADRLLVSGILQAEAVAALTASGAAAVTVVRPNRPYPNPERADVVWVLGVEQDDAIEPRLAMALRCLAPGACLLVELCSPEGTARAALIAAQLRHRGIETIRIEPLRAGIILVRGYAPAQQRRAV